jgi:ABC-type cobalt transport system substrate-binding protein
LLDVGAANVPRVVIVSTLLAADVYVVADASTSAIVLMINPVEVCVSPVFPPPEAEVES